VGDSEIPLNGGTLSPVVRVGATVRRPAGPWTPAVQALLGHLREQGFTAAPEPLGVDGAGREIVSYIEGETVGWSLPWPAWVRADSTLVAIGALMARFHRAVASFSAPAGARWRSGTPDGGDPAGHRLICHNDMAPYNVVASDGHIVGVIDWDLAGPAPAVWDLAFLAWQWVPLHGPVVSDLLGWSEPPARGRRLRLLLDAYGLADRDGFIDLVRARINENRAVMVSQAAAGDAAYQALVDQGHVAGMDEALGFLASCGADLQASSGGG
jgi:hypothetical protein